MASIAEAAGIPVTFTRIPIRDYHTPSRETMTRILDLIDRSLAAEKPVYVHCWGGRRRAGTVVG